MSFVASMRFILFVFYGCCSEQFERGRPRWDAIAVDLLCASAKHYVRRGAEDSSVYDSIRAYSRYLPLRSYLGSRYQLEGVILATYARVIPYLVHRLVKTPSIRIWEVIWEVWTRGSCVRTAMFGGPALVANTLKFPEKVFLFMLKCARRLELQIYCDN